MKLNTILVETQKGQAKVTINRPNKLNALNKETIEELSTAFKALEEESEYAGNVEQAQLLQSDRQAIAEKLQKDGETLSQDEIAQMQRDIQAKTKDLEFIVGKIQAKQNETADKVFRDLNPSLQKILSELIAAKEIKILLGRDNVLFADTALDLTDDVTSMLDVAAADGADKK